MNLKVSKFLSYILHPLMMPFIAVILVMNLNTYIAYSISPQVQRIIITLVFITTNALPILLALLLLQKGIIKSLEMDTLVERRVPFLTSAFFYFICYYLLKQLPIPQMLSIMVLAAGFTIFIAYFLSFRYKVSIHMIGIGGLTGVLFALSRILNADLLLFIIIAVLVSGMLGAARLSLGAHKPGQVYWGFLIGFVTEYSLLLLFS
jgi:hypothetical protein